MAAARTTIIARIFDKLGLDRLARREKIVLAAGCIFVGGFLFIQLVAEPFFSSKETVRRLVDRRQFELTDMLMLRQQYIGLVEQQSDIAQLVLARSGDFSLFSFLEQQAAAAGIKGRVAFMRPSSQELEGEFSESSVEMKIERLTTENLVDFLQRIEDREQLVFIRRMAIQKNSDEAGLLDITLNVLTYEQAAPREV
ncbi:MAG: type II secretion system protein M [Desulfofustis sp. PB-SRB1]|jgi:hypothetical protein|nr:type II secretion system protein M [Desulfofustis sp. PB-SRB1]MBM1003665.1 type II secretion system protein M [Desulfofustis sp. PB-SRB1]HBH27381.1 hypothetical protein [Desulfofustis sp.]HBH31605.1 hypothetical protein [Desulfofustis sp.]